MLFAHKTQVLTAKVAAFGVAFAITSASMSGCTTLMPVANKQPAKPNHERMLLIADTYAAQGQTKKAEKIYGGILRQRPHNEHAIAGLASIRGTAVPDEAIVAANAPKTVDPLKARVTAPPVAVAMIEAPIVEQAIVPPPEEAPPVVAKPSKSEMAQAPKSIEETPGTPAKAVVSLGTMSTTAEEQVAEKPIVRSLNFANAAAPSAFSGPSSKKTSAAKGEDIDRTDWANEYFAVTAEHETGLDEDLNDVIAAAYGLTVPAVHVAESATPLLEESSEQPEASIAAASGWRPSDAGEVEKPAIATVELEDFTPPVVQNASLQVSAANSHSITQAAEALRIDSRNDAAWLSMDEHLACGDPVRQSLAVLTLTELPPTCHDAVASRLQDRLVNDPDDDVRAAAALAIGGLGSVAEPVVPVLREIIQTAAQRPADAARVSLMCLGYEE